MANRFSSKDNVKRIDLGDGDWVEIPAVISFEDAEAIKGGKDNSEIARAVIRSWNLKEPNRGDVPVTAENVRRLDLKVINRIIAEVMALMTVPKAQSPESAAPSGEAGAAKS